jgi:hypothetical protein
MTETQRDQNREKTRFMTEAQRDQNREKTRFMTEAQRDQNRDNAIYDLASTKVKINAIFNQYLGSELDSFVCPLHGCL